MNTVYLKTLSVTGKLHRYCTNIKINECDIASVLRPVYSDTTQLDVELS